MFISEFDKTMKKLQRGRRGRNMGNIQTHLNNEEQIVIL